MSRTRTNDRAGHHDGHFAPEDLLELALEQSSGRVQTDAASARDHAKARACPQCSMALDDLLADLASVRSALRGVPSIDERRTATLAEATIGLTTREALTRRGSTRALGGWLSLRSWSSAPLGLRIVAASLLLHLIALPLVVIVLALQLRRQPPASVASASPATEIVAAPDPLEPRGGIARVFPLQAPAFAVKSFDLQTSSDRLAKARRDLLVNGAPKLSAFERQLGCSDGLAGGIARMLITRSRPLGMGRLDSMRRDPVDLELLERARCAERLLDDWVASGRVDRRLSAALWQLPAPSAEAAPVQSFGSAPARAAADGSEFAGALLDQAPSVGPDRNLFEALEQACASKLASEPAGDLASWLAWGRGNAR